MSGVDLGRVYREYIACLNAQAWPQLGRYVHPEVVHNGRPFGLAGYRAMLEQDFDDIPDLHFDIALLVVDAPRIASRLVFRCSPRARFMGLDINGRTVSFAEHVFYEFFDTRIVRVHSVIDKAAIEAQLVGRSTTS